MFVKRLNAETVQTHLSNDEAALLFAFISDSLKEVTPTARSAVSALKLLTSLSPLLSADEVEGAVR